MRKTGLWSVDCLCGARVEWADTSRETACACGRTVAVAGWPNVELKQVGQEAAR